MKSKTMNIYKLKNTQYEEDGSIWEVDDVILTTGTILYETDTFSPIYRGPIKGESDVSIKKNSSSFFSIKKEDLEIVGTYEGIIQCMMVCDIKSLGIEKEFGGLK
jgi:hypothetical protein